MNDDGIRRITAARASVVLPRRRREERGGKGRGEFRFPVPFRAFRSVTSVLTMLSLVNDLVADQCVHFFRIFALAICVLYFHQGFGRDGQLQ